MTSAPVEFLPLFELQSFLIVLPNKIATTKKEFRKKINTPIHIESLYTVPLQNSQMSQTFPLNLLISNSKFAKEATFFMLYNNSSVSPPGHDNTCLKRSDQYHKIDQDEGVTTKYNQRNLPTHNEGYDYGCNVLGDHCQNYIEFFTDTHFNLL